MMLTALVLLFAVIELASDPSAIIREAALRPTGKRYRTVAPDTLDLAERARLSVRLDFERAKNPKLHAVVVRDSTLTPLEISLRLQGFSASSQRN